MVEISRSRLLMEWSPNGNHIDLVAFMTWVVTKNLNVRCDDYCLNLIFSSDSRVLFCVRHNNNDKRSKIKYVPGKVEDVNSTI